MLQRPPEPAQYTSAQLAQVAEELDVRLSVEAALDAAHNAADAWGRTSATDRSNILLRPDRGVLGQRAAGELLVHPEDRALQPAQLRHPRRGNRLGQHLDRRRLQPPPALRPRPDQPGSLRAPAHHRGQPGRITDVHETGQPQSVVYCGRCDARGIHAKLIYTDAKGTGGQYTYYFCRNRKQGTCDLPYLPTWAVEDHVSDFHAGLTLDRAFFDTILGPIEATLSDEKASTRQLHDRLERGLARVDTKEERLIDLAADGELPMGKIKQRIAAIATERHRIRRELAKSGSPSYQSGPKRSN